MNDNGKHPSTGDGFWARHGWTVGLAVGLLFLVSRFGSAGYLDNERVYALGPLKLLDPDFLSRDFMLSRLSPFFLVTDALMAPLYLLFGALWATIVSRMLIWVFQLWALARLLRQVGLAWWTLPLLLGLWLNVEQTLVAGDWIFGCASGKPISYGFVFLTLEALLARRFDRAAICGGLSGSFHVIAGFWACAAVLGVLVVLHRDLGARRLIRFGALAVLFALPGLVPAIWGELLRPEAAVADRVGEVARLSVLLANPFHLDPRHFITGLEYLKLVVVLALTLLLLARLPRRAARPLQVFVALLAACFVTGLIARELEWYRYLKYYPFRLADSFVPLLMWIAVVALFQRQMERSRRVGALLLLTVPLQLGVVNYLVDRCETQRAYGPFPRGLITALSEQEPRRSAYWVRERGREWWRFLSGRSTDDFDTMAAWIRQNTPPDSVFIAPPAEDNFALEARRAQFVYFSIPVTARIFEWKRRMEALTGGPLQSVGHALWFEIDRGYARLRPADVERIRSEWGADYWLTLTDAESDLQLVHRVGRYRLYKL